MFGLPAAQIGHSDEPISPPRLFTAVQFQQIAPLLDERAPKTLRALHFMHAVEKRARRNDQFERLAIQTSLSAEGPRR